MMNLFVYKLVWNFNFVLFVININYYNNNTSCVMNYVVIVLTYCQLLLIKKSLKLPCMFTVYCVFVHQK